MPDSLTNGKIKCPKCEGEGTLGDYPAQTCRKCWGSGELDWVENVMGKPEPRTFFAEEATKLMAEALAKEIDEEIIESIVIDSYVDESNIIKRRE